MISDRVRRIWAIGFSLCCIAFALILLPHLAVAAELSPYEIDARFQRIGQTYSPGEELSEQDAAFVKQYAMHSEDATHPVNRATNGSTNVNSSRTMYGVSANLSGRVWHSGTFAYQWGGNSYRQNNVGIHSKAHDRICKSPGFWSNQV